MQKDYGTPDPKFKQFTELFNEKNQAIGFTIPNNPFLFQYDSQGGWYDQLGNYFNSDGICQHEVGDVGSEDLDSVEDQQIVDEFQKLLQEEQLGVIHKKKQQKKVQKAQTKQFDYLKQSEKLIIQYKQNKGIKEGLSKSMFLYFKIKSDLYDPAPKTASLATSAQDQNKIIKDKLIPMIEKKQDSWKQQNPWIKENCVLNFSGISNEESQYKRYWFGHVIANADNFLQKWKQIRDSKQFVLLQHKTFYALKSKFYPKKQAARQIMKKSIVNLCSQVQKEDNDNIVQIQLDRLPEEFPISYILDLMQENQIGIDSLLQIKTVDQYKALILTKKENVKKFANLQGYCQNKGEFIEIKIHILPNKVEQMKNWFKVSVDTKFKDHSCQLFDAMAIEVSKQGIVKRYTKQDSENEHYRVIVGQKNLKRVLMYRGQTFNVDKITRQYTFKPIEVKKE